MGQFARPKIAVSNCIEFDHCRYDGSLIPSDFIKALKPHVGFSPVCAEREIVFKKIRWIGAGFRLLQDISTVSMARAPGAGQPLPGAFML